MVSTHVISTKHSYDFTIKTVVLMYTKVAYLYIRLINYN